MHILWKRENQRNELKKCDAIINNGGRNPKKLFVRLYVRQYVELLETTPITGDPS